MRGSRLRYDKERCYYHLMNRVAGEPGVYPFGDLGEEGDGLFIASPA